MYLICLTPNPPPPVKTDKKETHTCIEHVLTNRHVKGQRGCFVMRLFLFDPPPTDLTQSHPDTHSASRLVAKLISLFGRFLSEVYPQPKTPERWFLISAPESAGEGRSVFRQRRMNVKRWRTLLHHCCSHCPVSMFALCISKLQCLSRVIDLNLNLFPEAEKGLFSPEPALLLDYSSQNFNDFRKTRSYRNQVRTYSRKLL